MQWKPEKYGGIQSIHVPPNQVWTPDVNTKFILLKKHEKNDLFFVLQVVLFNNADGKYEASFKSNVVVYSNGVACSR